LGEILPNPLKDHLLSTIIDVARLARVSKSTVSLVLTKSPKIHEDTKIRVIKAMEELDYRPRHSARSMAGKKTNTIGVLSIAAPCLHPKNNNFENCLSLFNDDVVVGIEEATRETNFGLIFARQTHIKDANLVRMTKSSHVDGLLVVTGQWNDELVQFVKMLDVPVVITGGNLSVKSISCVFIDEWKASYSAIAHLIAKGHKRIAFINSDDSSVNTLPKFNGYVNCLKESNLPFDPLLVTNSNFSSASGKKSMKQLLAYENRPTAVLCASDGIAVGAAHAILDAGLRIPTDIAVMGFEDSLLASHFHPPLTTIRIPKLEIGKIMTQEIIAIIEGTRSPGLTTLLETSVIERDST
jgi:LacI family transcriptional regulator, galactose operon repressor